MHRSTIWSFVIAIIFSCGWLCGCAADKDTSSAELKGRLYDKGQGICVDNRTGRMWLKKRGGVFYSSDDARQYVDTLQTGGYTDWRLPTKSELFDLHNIYFLKENGNCTMKRGGEYWATDKKGNTVLGHWETYHLCGPGFKYVKSVGTKGYVRAVRQTKK